MDLMLRCLKEVLPSSMSTRTLKWRLRDSLDSLIGHKMAITIALLCSKQMGITTWRKGKEEATVATFTMETAFLRSHRQLH
jgi:hypothetical protein